MKVKKTLLLTVDYEIDDKRDSRLPERCLEYLVQHATSEGLLSDDYGQLKVNSWEFSVIDGEPLLLRRSQKRDLIRLLAYNREAESANYAEMQRECCEGLQHHIWRVMQRLAKSIGYKHL